MKKISKIKLNSKGAASIFLVMSVLAAVLAIALGSSFVVSNEIRTSSDSIESMAAFYNAESGMEAALYDKVKLEREPRSNRCEGNCPGGFPGSVCGGSWTCTENSLGPAEPYCIEVTETTSCDSATITSIKSIGENKSTRRSIELTF